MYAKVQQHPVNLLGIGTCKYNVCSYVTSNRKSKKYWRTSKKTSSQGLCSILSKLGPKLTGIQACAQARPHLFPKGDNCGKLYARLFSSREYLTIFWTVLNSSKTWLCFFSKVFNKRNNNKTNAHYITMGVESGEKNLEANISLYTVVDNIKKIFYTNGPVSTKLCTKHPCLRNI